MKKLILIAILAFYGTTAFAQQGLRVGALAGYNLTFIINQNTYGEPELEYASKFGPGAGIQLNYNILPSWGIVVEAIYNRQGQKYEETKNGIYSFRDVDLRYMHFPVMIKYNSSEGLTRFFFMAGVQYSRLTSASITHTRDAVAQDDNLADAMERFQNDDFAFVTGIGTELWFGNKFYMSAGLRFNYGFNDINAPDWRKPNLHNQYNGSRNALGGIVIGGHVRL